jgi:exonuclease VII small subunit
MTERGADPARIETLHLSVDTDVWRPDPRVRDAIRSRLGVEASLPVILYAARLTPQKQPGVLGETLRRLRDDGVPFRALVAGDGPERPALEAFLQEHGLLEAVHLLGMATEEGVRELMQASDLFFLPSQWEGIALVLAEAMACGLAVVGADVGGQRELVTAESGVLVRVEPDVDEAGQYAAALARLIQYPARRAALGRAARERIRTHFAWDQGERLEHIVRKAAQLRVERPRPPVPPAFGHFCAEQAVECWWLLQQVANSRSEHQRGSQARPHPAAPVVGAETGFEAQRKELQAWIGQLEEGKAWLEEQRAAWEATARQQAQVIEALQRAVAQAPALPLEPPKRDQDR